MINDRWTQRSLAGEHLSGLLPGRSAGQRFACGSEDDVAGDHGEHPPHGEEPPPIQLDGEVHWHHPHLDKGHQLGEPGILKASYSATQSLQPKRLSD